MRRGYGIFLLGLLVCAAFLALLDPRLREPNYQGKPLSAWLNDFDNQKPEAREHAADAVRHIGAKAVPRIAAQLRSADPPWKVKLANLINRQTILPIRVRLATEDPTQVAQRRYRSLAACDALGPAAKRALPALQEYFNRVQDFDAAYAMARIGPSAIEFLTDSVQSKTYFVRVTARYFLGILRRDPGSLAAEGETKVDFRHRSRAHESNMIVQWLPEQNGAGP